MDRPQDKEGERSEKMNNGGWTTAEAEKRKGNTKNVREHGPPGP